MRGEEFGDVLIPLIQEQISDGFKVLPQQRVLRRIFRKGVPVPQTAEKTVETVQHC